MLTRKAFLKMAGLSSAAFMTIGAGVKSAQAQAGSLVSQIAGGGAARKIWVEARNRPWYRTTKARNITLLLPHRPRPGDLLTICLGFSTNPGPVNTPSGWERVQGVMGQSPDATAFQKRSDGTERKVTITWSNESQAAGWYGVGGQLAGTGVASDVSVKATSEGAVTSLSTGTLPEARSDGYATVFGVIAAGENVGESPSFTNGFNMLRVIGPEVSTSQTGIPTLVVGGREYSAGDVLSTTLRWGSASTAAVCLMTSRLRNTTGVLPDAADSLPQNTGVQIHVGFLDTAYESQWDKIVPQVEKLGVRFFRAGVGGWPERMEDRAYEKIGDMRGIGVNIMGIFDPNAPGSTIDKMNGALIDRICGYLDNNPPESWGGPNEPNNPGGGGWVADTRAYQEALYRAVKDSVIGSQVPVQGPGFSNVGDPASDVGNLSEFIDQNDFHPYASGRQPDDKFLDVGNRSKLYAAEPVAPSEPMVASECGYHTALDQTPGAGQEPVSEAVAAKYIPRMVMEMYRRRIICSIYELMDDPEEGNQLPQEQRFGLLNPDATPKPAYDSLRRLLNLLADKGGQPDLEPLEYNIYGNEAYIHSHLFQKSSGAYYLVLWQERPSWDTKTRMPINVPEKSVNIRLSYAHDAKVYRTLDRGYPVKTSTGVKVVQVNVPDSVVVVELVRSGV